ncbi:MAG: hypothetical protein R3E12_13485 [Candidatus Eisenbacteria bacterium]
MTRKLMGNPSRKVHLCGYSSGSTVGFCTTRPGEPAAAEPARIVDGFIGVDQGVVTDVSSWEESMCGVVESYQALIDSGQFQDYNPLPFFGLPARDDPNGMSEIPGFEGLTNLQAGLALGAYPFFPPDTGHFLSAVLDEDELPIGLLYTTVDWWVDFMVDSPPYEPCAFLRDEYITSCPAAGDVPWDDHLGDIRNPVLYVSAGGGFGYTGAYTLDLLGSPDVSELLVSVTTDPFFDVAHVDLFLANDTPALFWQPVLEWVDEHSR